MDGVPCVLADKEMAVLGLLLPSAVQSFDQDSQHTEFRLPSSRGGVLTILRQVPCLVLIIVHRTLSFAPLRPSYLPIPLLRITLHSCKAAFIKNGTQVLVLVEKFRVQADTRMMPIGQQRKADDDPVIQGLLRKHKAEQLLLKQQQAAAPPAAAQSPAVAQRLGSQSSRPSQSAVAAGAQAVPAPISPSIVAGLSGRPNDPSSQAASQRFLPPSSQFTQRLLSQSDREIVDLLAQCEESQYSQFSQFASFSQAPRAPAAPSRLQHSIAPRTHPTSAPSRPFIPTTPWSQVEPAAAAFAAAPAAAGVTSTPTRPQFTSADASQRWNADIGSPVQPLTINGLVVSTQLQRSQVSQADASPAPEARARPEAALSQQNGARRHPATAGAAASCRSPRSLGDPPTAMAYSPSMRTSQVAPMLSPASFPAGRLHDHTSSLAGSPLQHSRLSAGTHTPQSAEQMQASGQVQSRSSRQATPPPPLVSPPALEASSTTEQAIVSPRSMSKRAKAAATSTRHPHAVSPRTAAPGSFGHRVEDRFMSQFSAADDQSQEDLAIAATTTLSPKRKKMLAAAPQAEVMDTAQAPVRHGMGIKLAQPAQRSHVLALDRRQLETKLRELENQVFGNNVGRRLLSYIQFFALRHGLSVGDA